jgi:hypothetical protein
MHVTAQCSFYDIPYQPRNSCSTLWQVNVPLCQALRWEQITRDPKFNRQSACTFGLIHQGGGEEKRAREVLDAPEYQAPP